MVTVLVTGSEGCIGKPLVSALRQQNIYVKTLDTSLPFKDLSYGDIGDLACLENAVQNCDGIIHLAAVSRVAWGEEDPSFCWCVNVDGTKNLLKAAKNSPKPPWILFASSREVYGNHYDLPIRETHSLNPINVYGRSKAAAEKEILKARSKGLNTAIVRYTNVYGGADDHKDRAIPAFCYASALGAPLYVKGGQNTYDFIHLTDVISGTLKIIHRLLKAEQNLPIFHLLTGRAITLRATAEIAKAAGGGLSKIIELPSAQATISHFVGDAQHTMSFLDWRPSIPLEQGISTLVSTFRDTLNPSLNLVYIPQGVFSENC